MAQGKAMSVILKSIRLCHDVVTFLMYLSVSHNYSLQAVFWRESEFGRLTVDDQSVYTGKSTGDTRSISTVPPHFVGGLSQTAASKAANNLGVSIQRTCSAAVS